MPKPLKDGNGNLLPNDVVAYVSGTIGVSGPNARIALFGGDVYVSGSIRTPLGTLGTGGGGGSSTGWFDGTGKMRTTGSISISSQTEYASDRGADTWLWVSGTSGLAGASARKAVFGGDVQVSGSLTVGTGSVTITSNDIQFSTSSVKIERSGNNLKFYDGFNPSGKTLSLISSGSDKNAQYILASATASLPNGRQLNGGTGIQLSDSGPGGNFTISLQTPGYGGIYRYNDTSSMITLGDSSWTGFITSQNDMSPSSGADITVDGTNGRITIDPGALGATSGHYQFTWSASIRFLQPAAHFLGELWFDGTDIMQSASALEFNSTYFNVDGSTFTLGGTCFYSVSSAGHLSLQFYQEGTGGSLAFDLRHVQLTVTRLGYST